MPRKQTITKFTLACAVACLVTITPQPVLSQNVKQLFQQGLAAHNRRDFLSAESTFGYIISIYPNYANACQKANPWSIAYILRDDNRCEGILDRNISGDTLRDLISFATSKLTEYPDNLSIQVPGDNNQKPIISVQSFLKRYRLDELETEYLQSNHTFDLNTKKVLQHPRANVPIKSLRSLAFIIDDSEPVYYPVILEEGSNQYEFVIQKVKVLLSVCILNFLSPKLDQVCYLNTYPLKRSQQFLVFSLPLPL